MVSSVEQWYAYSPDVLQFMHSFLVQYFLVCLFHLSLPDHILRFYFILICTSRKRASQLNKEFFERFHTEMEDLIKFCWEILLLLIWLLFSLDEIFLLPPALKNLYVITTSLLRQPGCIPQSFLSMNPVAQWLGIQRPLKGNFNFEF